MRATGQVQRPWLAQQPHAGKAGGRAGRMLGGMWVRHTGTAGAARRALCPHRAWLSPGPLALTASVDLMPQVMAFAFVACLLLYCHRLRLAARQAAAVPAGRSASGASGGCRTTIGPVIQLLELVLLAALACAVAAGRVVLGYHSVDQVAAGAAFGAALAWVWFRATLWLSQTAFPVLEKRLAPLGMHWHDSLGQPDPLFRAAGSSQPKRRAAD